MVTTATVRVWGEEAGAIAWDDERGLGLFEFNPSFRATGWELSPLQMPLTSSRRVYSFPDLRRRNKPDCFKGLPGLLADVLPDKYGNRLIQEWLARNGRPADSMNPVETLCFIGDRGMGALEFEPSIMGSTQRTFHVEVHSLVDAARSILERREEFETHLKEDKGGAVKDLLRIGTSAGGARPKAVIAWNKTTGEIRSGQTRIPKGFSHWLIKLDGVSDIQLGKSHGYGRVEMAYHRMALDCGIEMMPCQLLEEGGRAHFMTQRFDRDGNQKHHIQTWCGLNHLDYNEIRSYGYEQLFQTMRRLKLDYPAAEQMFRRMVFNVLARNCDDHTKNFSFRLKKDDSWELAPAYDLCHAWRPGSEWVSHHALSVNGKRSSIRRSDLMAVAESVHIRRSSAIIDQVHSVVQRWKTYADEVRVDPELRDHIQKTLIRL
ncbi:MAG: type II toxin-antitoxin system HipA family toxin [Balneolaceae bacterium]